MNIDDAKFLLASDPFLTPAGFRGCLRVTVGFAHLESVGQVSPFPGKEVEMRLISTLIGFGENRESRPMILFTKM